MTEPSVIEHSVTPSSNILSNTSSPSVPPLPPDRNLTYTNQCLHNILLILFRYHPSGVLESELATFYHQMFNEFLSIHDDLKYLLRTQRTITITTTKQRGLLYTLNPSEIPNLLQTFNRCAMNQINQYASEHILRLFALFPNGIACICFEESFQNIFQFELSHVMSSVLCFLASNPFIKCITVGSYNVLFHTFYLNTRESLDQTKILTAPGGFHTLFRPLLHNNAFTGTALEREFEKKYKWRLNYEAPYISTLIAPNKVVKPPKQINLHKSPCCEDHYSVFMGGFPRNTSIGMIQRELTALGFVVVRCTEIKYRKYGYSWVTLSKVEEADALIQMSPIHMMGVSIEIRPYINRAKQHNEKPGEHVILRMMIKLLANTKYAEEGLSIRDIQLKLFELLSYRVSGSRLLEITKKYPGSFRSKSDVGYPIVCLRRICD